MPRVRAASLEQREQLGSLVWMRGAPLSIAGCCFLSAAVWLVLIDPHAPANSPVAISLIFLMVSVVVLVGLCTAVVLFNRPRLLVPPSRRSERGYISAMRRADGRRQK